MKKNRGRDLQCIHPSPLDVENQVGDTSTGLESLDEELLGQSKVRNKKTWKKRVERVRREQLEMKETGEVEEVNAGEE